MFMAWMQGLRGGFFLMQDEPVYPLVRDRGIAFVWDAWLTDLRWDAPTVQP